MYTYWKDIHMMEKYNTYILNIGVIVQSCLIHLQMHKVYIYMYNIA